MKIRVVMLAACALPLAAQESAARPADSPPAATESASAAAKVAPAAENRVVVEPGTKIPLSLINSVSTKQAAPGDRVYMETAFPIMASGRIVIPPGSYVSGTITQVKRPGRVKGRGELYLRFDSLTLPNGVTRDFRATLSNLDGRGTEELDRAEGKIRSEGNKGGDARTVGETAAGGASIGAIAGSVAGHAGLGVGIGAAAGAAAGLAAVLLSRGPDAVLAKGSTVEMVLDRPLQFTANELDFANAQLRGMSIDGGGPLPSKKDRSRLPIPGRGLPY